MKKLLVFTGVAEAATGVALMVAPAWVGHLLLGTELAGVSIVVARILGIALFASGIACWPGTPLCGMLTYNALGTVYFAFLAINGIWTGPLLWPVTGLHAVLTVLLGRAWFMRSKAGKRGNQSGE